jgi:hypothetical protein
VMRMLLGTYCSGAGVVGASPAEVEAICGGRINSLD